jgi:hypothetical protein
MSASTVFYIGLGIAVLIGTLIQMRFSDALKRRRDRVLRLGDRTHGWLIHVWAPYYSKGDSQYSVSKTVFEARDPDCADFRTLIIISPDADTNEDAEFMTELAEDIAAIRKRSLDRLYEDEARVQDLLRIDCYREGRRNKLPKSLTDGRTVFLAHLYVFREHLPNALNGDRRILCSIIWDEHGLICSRPTTESKYKRGRNVDPDD